MEEKQKTYDDDFEPMLGMIIKIVAPNDNRFNNKYFLIDYLDSKIMKIIDDKYQTYELNIENNELSEKSISYILPVKTPFYPGYAKQNNMIPGTWWTIEFNPEGGNPSLYNGEIINLEEDQIEFKIENTNDILYIDFEYKGIPLDMPIKLYRAVNPNIIQKKAGEDIDLTMLESDPRFEEEGGWADMMDEDEEYQDELTDRENIEAEKKALIIEADKIEFKILDEQVTFDIEKEEEEKIYHISVQTDDLLQSLLSFIPSNKRTPQKLQEISLIINRFTELRNEFSEFNEFNNTEIWKKYSELKPLVTNIKRLKKNINWTIPIIKNQLNIYFDKKKDIDNDTDNDMIIKNTQTSHTDEYELKDNYYQKKYDNEEFNKYDFINIKSFKPNHSIPLDKSNIMTKIEGKYSFKTKTDLLTISNNLNNNLQSSIIDVKSEKLNVTTFNTHLYISGQYKLNPIKNDLHERIQFTNGDIVPMTGLLMLPYPYIKKSQETFISTSIYNKVNSHKTPLMYFNYLKPNKHIRKLKINTNSEQNNILNFKSNTLYLYDENNVNYDDRNKEQDLDDFLNKIIPDTKNIITNNILNKYFDGCVSFERVLFKLQPFFIEHKDLDEEHSNIIKQKIYEEINFIRAKKQKNINDINLYFKSLPDSYSSQSPLVDIIPEQPEEENQTEENNINENMIKSIKNAYDIFDNELQSEYLQKIINTDTSNYLYDCIVFNQLDIINDININSVIEDLQKKIESSEIQDGTTKNSNCDLIPSSLAKRYKNIEELQNDEGMVIYYDKDYDDTRYDIYDDLNHIQNIEDISRQRKMLMNHLIIELDVPEEEASEQAINMIEGKKLIKDNDYAVLDKGTNNLRYYKRLNNRWVLDEMYNDTPIQEIQFCNLRNGCIKVNKKCESIGNMQENLELELMKDMLDKVENELKQNTIDMKTKIRLLLQDDLKNIIVLNEFNRVKNLKYDILKTEIANNHSSIEYEKSPSLDIRDVILNTQDIILKYDRLLKFCDKYCRYANIEEGEDINWFYCSLSSEQSFRLMPTFFYDLANSFSQGNYNNYYQTLEKIKRDRGELSDDGDKIIDRYSGYEIAKIQSTTEEGYEASGRKIISRGILDKTFDEQLKEQEKELKTNAIPRKVNVEEELDQYSINIQKLLPGIDNHLGIDTSSQYKFISKNVLYLMEKKLEKEKTWITENNDELKDLKDKEKKKKYSKHKIDFYCKTLIGLYLIAIQTNFPHIKKGKGFTGCVEAFTGWPIGKGDEFITYIVCSFIVIRGSGKAQNIWQGLPKYKKDKKDKAEKKYVEKLKKHMKKYIMKLDDVKDKIQKKIEFLKDNKQETKVSESFDYKSWNTFLPPLIDFNLNKLTSPNSKIESIIKKSFEDTNIFKSQGYLNNITSQIQAFSLSVQEDIQRIINKQPVEDLLLKSQTGDTIFLENACCNESNDSPYEYFVNKEKNNDIADHNNKVKELTNILYNVNLLLKSNMFNSLENTRQQPLKLSNTFSEKTIYQSFITFCKFNNGLPLNNALQSFCSSNESGFTKLNTLEEKIEIMKSENHIYNHDSLMALLNYIGEKSNPQLIEIELIASSKSIFEKLLETFENEKFIANIHTISYNVLDRFDVVYSERTDQAVEEFNTKIELENNKLHKTIKEILNNKKDKRLLEAFDNIHKQKNIPTMDIKRGEELFMSKNDENGYFIYDFLLTMSKNISYVYPNRIINNVLSNKSYLKYWEMKTLRTKLESNSYQELLSLDSFVSNDDVKTVLKTLIKNTENIILFFENIPFYAEIGEIHTIFNGKMIHNISYYLFLSIIIEHFNIIEEMYQDIDNESVLKRSRLKSQKETLTNDIIDLIYNYISIIVKYKKNISKSRYEILESSKKFREKDRDQVTAAYKLLSDDEKKVEKLKQKHKLGSWSVGATKAIFQYDEEFTERELKRLEERTLDEYRVQKNDLITNELIDALDLNDEIDKINRERLVQEQIDKENDTQFVFGENEDEDDLEQFDTYE